SGGHFNPSGGTHGKFAAPGSHAGELPSLVANGAGEARFSVENHAISLTPAGWVVKSSLSRCTTSARPITLLAAPGVS
ncbi:superoxide dismutase family protein, partial [Xylella fastidiosa subsp. multiplex]|nr:superoxide dismutase family protein [Xylella fastidiosa subsp. multiplex]